MEASSFLLQLLVILLAARIFAEVATRLKSPSVIGELMAGVVFGPSLLGWVEVGETIRLLAEIGIILLLFEVGLETDVQGLVRSGGKAIVVAITGFVLPFIFGFSVSYWVLEFNMLTALFVGGTLTATSIGITVRVLSDLRRQQSTEGRIVLGAAVLDDILGVILLAVLYEFSISGGVSIAGVGKVLLFVALFFALSAPIAKVISLIIKRYDRVSEVPGLVPTTIVTLVLFFAWVAHEVGAPELLGGFAAGLALSRRFFLPFGAALHADPDFAQRVEFQMKPIVHLFTPIFFVVVGLSLNLKEIDWGSGYIWLLSCTLLVAAVLGKLTGALLLRESWPVRCVIGTAMVPRGEIGLIFAELGRLGGILNHQVYAGLVFVIALTTLLPPFVMKYLYRKYPHELPTGTD